MKGPTMDEKVTNVSLPPEEPPIPDRFDGQFKVLCNDLKRIRQVKDLAGNLIGLDLNAQLIWDTGPGGTRNVVVIMKCTNSRQVNLVTAVHGPVDQIHSLLDIATKRILDMVVDYIA